jgi:hypothetical protein
MGEEGLEPPTDYLEGSCSIQLSYSPALAQYYSIHCDDRSDVNCQIYEKMCGCVILFSEMLLVTIIFPNISLH